MNNEIAQRLVDMRRSHGYSQEELAEKLGLSRQAISKWERAESSPDTGNLLALSRLYGVTLDELVCGTPDEMPEAPETLKEGAKEGAKDATPEPVPVVAPAPEPAPAPVVAPEHTPAPEPAVPTQQAAQPAPVPLPQTYAAQQPTVQQPPAYQAQPQAQPVAYVQPAAYTQPAAAPAPQRRGAWSSFPYPVVCACIYLIIGFCFGWWHPGWIIFLTIPFYYWLAKTIQSDPTYQQNHQQNNQQ